MPGQGMGQMIQMITALAEMQDRRRKIALDEQQYQTQKEQFGQQLGFQEKNTQTATAFKLIDLAAKGGAEGVAALHQLGMSLGLSEEQAQQISHVGMDAGSALQRIEAQRQAQQKEQEAARFQQAQAGYDSMGNPDATPQQKAGQAAWYQQNAGGPAAMGQMATGNLIGQLAGQAEQQITPGSPSFNEDMARRMAQGYGIQQATRETPWGFAVGQAGIKAGLAPAAASIGAGVTPIAGDMLRSQDNQADILGRLAASKNGQPDLGGQVSALNAVHQIAKDLADKKYADKNTMNTMIGQYNAFVRLLEFQGVRLAPIASVTDAPSALSRIELWMKGATGSSAPGGGKGGGRPPGGY